MKAKSRGLEHLIGLPRKEREEQFTTLLDILVHRHGLERVEEMYEDGDPTILEPFTALDLTPQRADQIWGKVKRGNHLRSLARGRVKALSQTPEVLELLERARDATEDFPPRLKTMLDLERCVDVLDRLLAKR